MDEPVVHGLDWAMGQPGDYTRHIEVAAQAIRDQCLHMQIGPDVGWYSVAGIAVAALAQAGLLRHG